MEAFLFDIGNVIVHFDFTTAGNQMAKLSPVEADPIKRIAPLKQQLESGQIDGAEFVARSIERIRFQGTADEFTKMWEDVFTPNLPMWESIRSIHGRLPIYLLSNTSDLHKFSLFRDFEIFELIDGGVYSFSAQSEKPEPQIYQTAIDELGLDPAQTLYVDDLQENIKAGVRAGFVSHHYHPDHHDKFIVAAAAQGFQL